METAKKRVLKKMPGPGILGADRNKVVFPYLFKIGLWHKKKRE
jgi:hypothetical protein